MLDDRVIDLVNREIDGEAGADEARELSTLRKRHEEIDSFFLETRELCEALDDVCLLEDPPEGFAELVSIQTLRAVETRAAATPFVSRAAKRRRVAMWSAMAAAAALLVAVLLWPVVIRTGDEVQMSGAMTTPTPATSRVLDLPIAAGDVTGSLQVVATGEHVRLVATIFPPSDSESPTSEIVTATIVFDPRTLRVASTPPDVTVDGDTGTLTAQLAPAPPFEISFARLQAGETTINVTIGTPSARWNTPVPLPVSDK